jgi:putative Mn2+ efflux pump MntP
MSKIPSPVGGLEQDSRQLCASRRRSIALVELIITAALALSTAVAVTAVSIGIARAEVAAAAANSESAVLPALLAIGLLLFVMAALGAVMTAGQRAESKS